MAISAAADRCGKQGPVHVLDAAKLKGVPVQVLPMAGGIYSAPAYWNGHVFVYGLLPALR
jgi:hypothetical protein